MPCRSASAQLPHALSTRVAPHPLSIAGASSIATKDRSSHSQHALRGSPHVITNSLPQGDRELSHSTRATVCLGRSIALYIPKRMFYNETRLPRSASIQRSTVSSTTHDNNTTHMFKEHPYSREVYDDTERRMNDVVATLKARHDFLAHAPLAEFPTPLQDLIRDAKKAYNHLVSLRDTAQVEAGTLNAKYDKLLIRAAEAICELHKFEQDILRSQPVDTTP